MLVGLEDQDLLETYLKENIISDDILRIAWVMDKPTRLPVSLEQLYNIKNIENNDVRIPLARAQVDAALRMNENLQKYTKQKYVAETIERLIFGELLLEGKGKKKNNNGNGDGTPKKKKRTTAGKKKSGVKAKPKPSKKS